MVEPSIAMCESIGMTTPTSTEGLAQRIEQLVQEHMTACRRAAEKALEHGFGTAISAKGNPKPARQKRTAKRSERRSREDIAAQGEQLYQEICGKPGETMAVLAGHLGTSARELNRPIVQLKRAGRVRSVGQRNLTRYFPKVDEVTAQA